MSHSTFQSPSVFLAAADEVTRQRCVCALQAAITGGVSSPLQSIASTVALTRDLFSIRSLAAVTSVFAALGISACDPALEPAIRSKISLLKHFQFDASELRAGGFDAATLKYAGFTAEELALPYGLDLPALLALGYDAAALRGAGFSTEDAINGGYPEVTAVSVARARNFHAHPEQWTLLLAGDTRPHCLYRT